MHKPLYFTAFAVLAFGLTALGADNEGAKIVNNVSSEALEKILDGMDIKYKKIPGKKDGVTFYDLDSAGKVVRLHNYSGQDLWLDCVFGEKTSLQDVNGWNTRAKYSRAVLIKQDERTTISLESQLDCLGGVTDAIVRQFIRRFGGEVKAFEKYISK
jgi:hypothetical protein